MVLLLSSLMPSVWVLIKIAIGNVINRSLVVDSVLEA
jgi:hypothetical protein